MTAAMNPATTHHPFSFGDTPKTTARMAGSVTVKVAIGTMMLRRTSQEDEPRILATTAHQQSHSLLPVSCGQEDAGRITPGVATEGRSPRQQWARASIGLRWAVVQALSVLGVAVLEALSHAAGPWLRRPRRIRRWGRKSRTPVRRPPAKWIPALPTITIVRPSDFEATIVVVGTVVGTVNVPTAGIIPVNRISTGVLIEVRETTSEPQRILFRPPPRDSIVVAKSYPGEACVKIVQSPRKT